MITIKEISTEQFAGMRGKKVELDGGINVVFGKNEAGKSTLVNLISRTLFQHAKLDGRRDESFIKSFFPAENTKGASGDTVFGRLVIEAPDGTYTLQKQWNKKSPSLTLTAPSGVFTDPDTIKKTLEKLLSFGEGVYTELLLSPQKDAAKNLQNLLEHSLEKDTNEAINSAVSEALSVGGAMSFEAFENAVNAKISALVGNEKYWDDSKKRPISHKRLQKGIKDSVIEAFYACEDADAELGTLRNLESRLDGAKDEYKKRVDEQDQAKNDIGEFERYAGQLQLKKDMEALEKTLGQLRGEKTDWEASSEALEKAKALELELDALDTCDAFDIIGKLRAEWQESKEKLEKKPCPDEAEIKTVKNADRDIEKQQSLLRGMNISAKIKKLSADYSVIIKSVRTGEQLDINAPLTEAVIVEIPGVLEMELSPAGVDAQAMNMKIAGLTEKKHAVLGKYGACSSEELEKLRAEYGRLADNAANLEKDYARALGGRDYDELEAKAKSQSCPRGRADVEGDIRILCGGKKVHEFIVSAQAEIGIYERNYTSPEALAEKIKKVGDELNVKKTSALHDGEIPEKYRGIELDSYKSSLENKLKYTQNSATEAYGELKSAETNLNVFNEAHPENLTEKLEKRQRAFNEKVEELYNWKYILSVFRKHKEAVRSNPLDTLAENFKNNLSQIASGVSSEFDPSGKLELRITSGDNKLDFGKLSEGTKETVYLAFRLAVLDHLFPDGGGVIVLDDPLNDMDIDRVKTSCELIKKSAEKHQVILLTCREEYSGLLGVKGKEICI